MCLGSNGAASESLLEEHADHHRRGKTPPDVAGVRGPSRRDPTPTTPSTANSQHKLTSISKHKSTSICKLHLKISTWTQKSCPCLNHPRMSNFLPIFQLRKRNPSPTPSAVSSASSGRLSAAFGGGVGLGGNPKLLGAAGTAALHLTASHHANKFGAASPHAVKKLLSLR